MKKMVKTPVRVEKVVEQVIEERNEIVEVEGGMDLLLEKKVLILCNYFYYGTLTGINAKYIELSDPGIVYESGSWSDKNWKDLQLLPTKKIFINLDSIESYFEVNK
jgi:hypothetical protein